jgi:hypothetical protein
MEINSKVFQEIATGNFKDYGKYVLKILPVSLQILKHKPDFGIAVIVA